MLKFKIQTLLLSLIISCNLLPMQQSEANTSASKPAENKQKTIRNKKKKEAQNVSIQTINNPAALICSSSSSSTSAPTSSKQQSNSPKTKKALAKVAKKEKLKINSRSCNTSSSSSSSSSSPCSSSPISVPKPKNIFLTDKAEIDALADKYKNPIPIHRIPGILSEVLLTKKTLKHVFGMKIGRNKDDIGSFYLTGFHHDLGLQLQEKIYYHSSHCYQKGVCEGFIAHSRQQFPVYKTLFSSRLSRNEIISMLIEALHDIKSIEDQEHVWKIEGTTKNNIDIIAIIKKIDDTVVTFYPKGPKTDSDRKKEANALKITFTKFFFNSSKKPPRQPITKEESEQLLALYPHGIEVNWVLAQADINTQDYHDYTFLTHHKELQPFFQDTLLNQPLIDELLEEDPGKIINIKSSIPKINITLDTLNKVFSEQNDSAFPKYLSRTEILEKLKEAIENFLPKEDYDSDEEESSSQSQSSESGTDSEERKENHEQPEPADFDPESNYPIAYGTLTSSDGFSINCTTHLPRYCERGELIGIRSTSDGKGPEDTWKFYILIDPATGNIVNFYPLSY